MKKQTILLSTIILVALVSLGFQNCGGMRSLSLSNLTSAQAVADDWMHLPIANNYLKKTFDFSSDPHWVESRNRPIAGEAKSVTQKYGYTSSNNVGLGGGEIGGLFSRSLTKSYYADNIGQLTLNDRLRASGTFVIKDGSDGGAFIGWFNSREQGWRPPNFLGLHTQADHGTGYALGAFTSATWNAAATGYTEFPALDFHNRHTFSIDYNPDANSGLGSATITLDGNTSKIDFTKNYRDDGALFDRFGIFHLGKSAGASIEIYFDDIEYESSTGTKKLKFSSDPNWEGVGNNVTFNDLETYGNFDFGYDAENKRIGGLIWRMDNSTDSYIYATSVGPLNQNDYLEASGTVTFPLGQSDSGAIIGWFNNTWGDEDTYGNLGSPGIVGIEIEGPSAVGFYFRPIVKAGKERGDPNEGPVILPDGSTLNWRIIYDPNANFKSGAIKVYLGDQTYVYDLPPVLKQNGFTLDHFGIFPVRPSGSGVKIYFDDLTFVSGKK